MDGWTSIVEVLRVPCGQQVGQRRTVAVGHLDLRRAQVHEADHVFVVPPARASRPLRGRTRPSRSATARRSPARTRRAAGCRPHCPRTAFARSPAPCCRHAGRRPRRVPAERRCSAHAPFQLGVGHVRVIADRDRGQLLAERELRLTLQSDQPERHQLAVVGHADRRFQQGMQARLVGRRLAQLARGHGMALLEQGKGSGHRSDDFGAETPMLTGGSTARERLTPCSGSLNEPGSSAATVVCRVSPPDSPTAPAWRRRTVRTSPGDRRHRG